MVNYFKRVSAFPPLLVCGKHFADIHLETAKMIAFDDAFYIQQSLFPDFLLDIMKRKGNDGQVCNSSTRACAAVFVLCVEKTGSEFFINFVTRAS